MGNGASFFSDFTASAGVLRLWSRSSEALELVFSIDLVDITGVTFYFQRET